METIVGENLEAEKHYSLWHRSVNEPFGAEKHLIPVYDNDYANIMREFVRYLSVSLDNLNLDRVYRGSPMVDFMITKEHCVPGGMNEDLAGKVIAIKPVALAPEYRSLSRQLMRCDGGFGSKPDSRGRAVFCTDIYSGENVRYDRIDILGVVKDELIPEWARKNLAAFKERDNERVKSVKQAFSTETNLPSNKEANTKCVPSDKPEGRAPADKESVLEQIKQDRQRKQHNQQVNQQKPNTRKRDKGGPEL